MKKFKRSAALIFAILMIVTIMPVSMFTMTANAASDKYYSKYGVTYNQLFTLYPQYLSPDTEHSIVEILQDRYHSVLDSYSSGDNFIASYMYSLKNGITILGREVLAGFGLTQSTKEIMMSDTSELLMQNICNTDKAMTEAASEVSDNFKHMKNVYTTTTTMGKVEFIDDLKAATKNLSDEDIEKLADELFKKSGTLMKIAGTGIEYWQLIVGVIEMQEIQEEAIYRLLNALPENSSLADALVVLLEDMNKDIVGHVLDHYCTDKSIELISDAIKTAINTAANDTIFPGAIATALGKLIISVFTDYIYQGAMADDIVQTTYLSTYVTELEIAVTNCKINFMLADSVETTAVSEYAFIYSSYIVAMRTALESCLKMAKTNEEKSVVQSAISLCDSYTYDRYIELCMQKLQEDIAAGKVKTPANASEDSNNETINSSTPVVTAVNQNTVINRINNLEELFPTGSYFTTTGKNSCSKNIVYGSNYSYCYSSSCPTCKLSNVLEQNSKAKNTIVPSVYTIGGRYSCCSFAAFAFCYIFEHDPSVNTYTISSDNYGGINEEFLSQLRPGDYVVCDNGSHYAIFLSYDSNYIYFYESNYDSPNQVEYNHKRSWTRWSKMVAHRSNTYNATPSAPVNDLYKLTSPDGIQTVRSQPSTTSSSVGELKAGTYVCVTQYNNDKSWGYITHDGVSGWIRLYYVELHNTHSYDSWTTTKEATCTISGSQQRKCACGATETKQIEALGHNYSNTYTIEREPSCTQAGSKYRKCSRCSAKTDITDIPATGHNYGEWKTVKEASCTADGRLERNCACGTTETKQVAALGHNYSNIYTIEREPTCTQAGSKYRKCTRCSAKTDITGIPAIGHNYGGWETVLAASCTSDGRSERSCACGATETKQIDALGHNYSDTYTVEREPACTQAGSKYRKCTRCSAKTDITDIPAIGHNYGGWETVLAASCTSDGRSERSCACGVKEYKTISATGHKWSEWTVTKEASTEYAGESVRTCSLCSEQDVKAIPKLSTDGHEHIFDENAWVEITPSTCIQEGRKERYCHVCHTADIRVIPPLTHAFTDWQTVLEPTAEQEGISARTCSRCTFAEELPLPKLNTPTTLPSTNPTSPSDSAPTSPSDVPTQPDSHPENYTDNSPDTLVILTAVSLLFCIGSICVLVIVLINKKKA